MQFSYVQICAILSNDRINDGAVKTLIAKEAQEWDVVDPGGLKKAAAFKSEQPLVLPLFLQRQAPGTGDRNERS